VRQAAGAFTAAHSVAPRARRHACAAGAAFSLSFCRRRLTWFHPGVYPGVYPGAQAGLRELLRGLGLPARALPGPLLRLRREVSSAGAGGGVRSRCFVNGAATPLRVLREVGAALVDVNGQHAAQTLRRAPAAPATPCRRAALLDRSSARQGS